MKPEELNIKTPLNDLILVESEKEEEVTKGGIIVPDAFREDTGVATILSISPDLRYDTIKVGDKVAYKKGKIDEVTQGDKFKALIHYRDLMGVLDE